MADNTKSGPNDDFIPANDNQGPESGPEREVWKRVDHMALTLARIIGRRMAREDFAARLAANDDRPLVSEKTEDGADKE
jgi:hypothetical protein